MEAVIDANVQLDYIEFQIFPAQNRFDASVCYANKKEKVTSGILKNLLQHSPDAEALNSKGSSAKYKVTPPENTNDTKWFTKSTLIRFLSIIGSSNVLDITKSVKNEISQLEEARKFHVSLYAKSTGSQLQSVDSESDSCFGTGAAITPIADGSDASKNELLRAIDLRLTALDRELTAAFAQAAGSRLSVEEMDGIEKFCNHIGSIDLRDSLRKHIQLIQRNQVVDNSSTLFADGDRFGEKDGNNENAISLSSDLPVRYGVSPAKVAQIERQSSTGSDTTSLSSEEEQPSAGRSRSLIRSASPRRSASPMRRVQIGRSGSRRSTAITIKSLNHIPARDKSFFSRDSDDEGSNQAPKKSESNARVISVKDAINLFESKQKDQTADVQKAKSLLTASIGANKSVLRRWSSGIGEDSYQHPQDIVSEDDSPRVQNNLGSDANSSSEAEAEAEPSVASDCNPIEPCGLDRKVNSPEKRACSPLVMQEETFPAEHITEKITAPDEWSRQKEAELNELLMKMMETKPVKSRKVVPDSSKRQSFPAEKRGGLYDNYKEKRDEKLRGETTRKKAEKDKQFKAMQQVLDARKSQLSAANKSDAVKKNNVKKPQKSQRDLSQPANSKTESPKLSVVKKASTKASSLPAVRKSLPSMPSSRASGASPAKTPPSITSTGPAPARRKSQPPSPVSRLSPKVGKSEQPIKPINSTQVDSKKTLRGATEKKQHSAAKPSKTATNKVQTASEESASSTKPTLYSKVTKKSSVVPLESKPFLRKGTGTFTSSNQLAKKKVRSVPQEAVRNSSSEPLGNSEEPIPDEENETISSNPVIQHQENDVVELQTPVDIECENSAKSTWKCEDRESFTQKKFVDTVVEPGLEDDIEEESTISPTAWVEIEEQEDRFIASSDPLCQTGSPAFVAPVGVSSPRVRHSLSQMLLEETSEPDTSDWGNAENPQPTFYQKDAPKGLKRLLKFARKSKTDTNSTGWSSPSVFSEGEDDAEDLKFGGKRNSENLLKKATLHSKNNGHQKTGYDAYQKNFTVSEQSDEANTTKSNAKSLFQQIQEGHTSASMTTTKATRSFFSLSAFKGSK